VAAIVTNVANALGETFQTLVTDFLNGLESIATSVSNFASATLSAILTLVKDLALGLLRLVDVLVQSVLSFFGNNLVALGAALFGAAFGGPVLQALYDLINPGSSEDLTLQGLGCLVAGFVSTVLYKILFDAVPYPSGAADSAPTPADVGKFFILAGILQAVPWLLLDLDLDTGAPVDLKWKYFALAVQLPMLIQLLLAPPSSPAWSDSKWIAWGAGFSGSAWKLLWGVNMVATGAKGPRATLPGSAGLSLCAGISLSANIYSASKTNPPWELWLSGVASPLSGLVKPARQLIADPRAQRLVLLGTDTVSDAGGGIAKIIHGAKLLSATNDEDASDHPSSRPLQQEVA
jgi:hypothetical protein